MTKYITIYFCHISTLSIPKYIKILIGYRRIKSDRNDYESYLEESIKCHHNEIASYIYDDFIDKKKKFF